MKRETVPAERSQTNPVFEAGSWLNFHNTPRLWMCRGEYPCWQGKANGGVYQSVHGKRSHLRLLLINHDVPLKSAVFHAGTWGDHLYALC